MFFSTKKVNILQRKKTNTIYPTDVKVNEYKELARTSKNDCIVVQLFNELKKHNRVINGSYQFVADELMPIYFQLLTEHGSMPNKIIASNEATLEKFKECIGVGAISKIFEKFEFEVCPGDISKNFVIMTYKDIDKSGLVIGVENDEVVLHTPVYENSEYDNSHYNYYYGIKFYE